LLSDPIFIHNKTTNRKETSTAQVNRTMPREERAMAEPKKKSGGFWGLFRTQSSANKARKLVCAPPVPRV
jgi:hypothetical protein